MWLHYFTSKVCTYPINNFGHEPSLPSAWKVGNEGLLYGRRLENSIFGLWERCTPLGLKGS